MKSPLHSTPLSIYFQIIQFFRYYKHQYIESIVEVCSILIETKYGWYPCQNHSIQ